MKGVLNETTNRIHKFENGGYDFQTRCGATYHVTHDQLCVIPVDRAVEDSDANRCGRCFEDGGGY